ncbi:MAG: DUF423 domain-containing protein [SAR324 cluster bacterium]|nr:DUF423 domain-containing protein [SAR324 cluster bacterium]
MSRIWLIWAGALGALGIALGAFGVHALRPVLPLQTMTVFETAVRYHLFHTLALLGVAILMGQYPDRAPALRWVALLLLAGLVLFSGSLYALATTGVGFFGWITPFGGACWIAAWLGLAWSFRRNRGG